MPARTEHFCGKTVFSHVTSKPRSTGSAAFFMSSPQSCELASSASGIDLSLLIAAMTTDCSKLAVNCSSATLGTYEARELFFTAPRCAERWFSLTRSSPMSRLFRSIKIATLAAALGATAMTGTGSAFAVSHHRVYHQQGRALQSYAACDRNGRAWYDRFNAQDQDPTLEMRAKALHACQ